MDKISIPKTEEMKEYATRQSVLPGNWSGSTEERYSGAIKEYALYSYLRPMFLSTELTTSSINDIGDVAVICNRNIYHFDAKSITGNTSVWVSEEQLLRNYRYYVGMSEDVNNVYIHGYLTKVDFMTGLYVLGRSGPTRTKSVGFFHDFNDLITYIKAKNNENI